MDVGLKDLLRAGVHFGHQTHRWNPKMRKYIFAERGGIYLIDLKKTLRDLERAQELVRKTVIEGKSVLFVCTKTQLAGVVREQAERSGSYYVTERWLGGMLTNFQTIKKNIRRLKELDRGVEEGAFEFYTKKEQLLLTREQTKLERYLSGIKDMTKLPGLVFVVDAKKEEIAVKEANRLGIPVVAIADTNADPDLLTIAIAGNDDAIRSVSLITGSIADVIESARNEMPDLKKDDKSGEAYTYSSDAGDVEDRGAPSRKKRPRRRPSPEAIAQRVKPAEEEAAAAKAPAAEAKADEAPAADAPAAEAQPAEAAEPEAPAEPKAEVPVKVVAEEPAAADAEPAAGGDDGAKDDS